MLNIWFGVRIMVNNHLFKSLNFLRISYWYWFGLNRSSSVAGFADGMMREPLGLLNEMFTISAALSLEEHTAPLKVYNTTYFTLLGKKVKTLDKGLYIKVMQTNNRKVSEKIYTID